MLKTKRSCNRHADCYAAETEWYRAHPERQYIPVNFHCHDDECEDCFGN